MSVAAEATLETLLDFIKRNRGFDFTGYKRSSVERRIRKRMEEVSCQGYGDYLDHLEVHQDEFIFLFNMILINVTAFFRDAPTWDYVRNEVVPTLIASRPADAPLRVWCAGCASGEEAYTIAMVLADVLGESAFRERVKIYATDVDEEALSAARHAAYAAKAVESVPREALDRYFERFDSRYVFRQDLRRTVIFGRNDLVQDAPISRIDLLICRNTLMYFNAETQGQILRRFNFGLANDGVLLLGKSEMLITHGDLFQPVDLKRRVFRKVVSGAMRDRLHFVTHPDGAAAAPVVHPSLRDSALDAGAVPQVVVDAESRVVAINQPARDLFAVRDGDVGRPLQDLELSYRPVDLRSMLDRLREDQRAVAVDGVRWDGDGTGSARILDVRLVPLLVDGALRGASISYVDVTVPKRLRDELEHSKHELEDDERGAPVDQRGARDDQRRAPDADTGAQRGQRVPGDDPGEHGRRGRRARRPPDRADLERARRGPLGPAGRRSRRPTRPEPRHRPPAGSAATGDPRGAGGRRRGRHDHAGGDQPARPADRLHGHDAAAGRRGRRDQRSDPADGARGPRRLSTGCGATRPASRLWRSLAARRRRSWLRRRVSA